MSRQKQTNKQLATEELKIRLAANLLKFWFGFFSSNRFICTAPHEILET